MQHVALLDMPSPDVCRAANALVALQALLSGAAPDLGGKMGIVVGGEASRCALALRGCCCGIPACLPSSYERRLALPPAPEGSKEAMPLKVEMLR